jgi:hypothetical protein
MSESETISKLILYTVHTFNLSNAVIFVFVFRELKECVKIQLSLDLMPFKSARILLQSIPFIDHSVIVNGFLRTDR